MCCTYFYDYAFAILISLSAVPISLFHSPHQLTIMSRRRLVFVFISLLLLCSFLSCGGTLLPLPINFPAPSSWRRQQGQIIPNILHETMARINPAIEDLELSSMVPSMPFSDKDANSVKFYLYSSKGGDSDSSESGEEEEELVVNDLSSVNSSSFDASYDVKILIHGWSMSIKSKDFPGPLKNAYLDASSLRRKYNVICVDWSGLSREFLYFNSVLYADRVGRRVGEFIMFLHLGGFIPHFNNVHVIGFSLGAHVGGVAGHFVQKSSNDMMKIGRITGLDPAGPGFSTDVELALRLDASDATFVDLIHTNMGQLIKGEFGSPLTATADFYPNGGHRQPGCELSLLREYSVPRRSGCNHMKSIDYFVQSIETPFLACKCRDWASFLAGGCNCGSNDNLAIMGEHCDNRARGKYYLHIR